MPFAPFVAVIAWVLMVSNAAILLLDLFFISKLSPEAIWLTNVLSAAGLFPRGLPPLISWLGMPILFPGTIILWQSLMIGVGAALLRRLPWAWTALMAACVLHLSIFVLSLALVRHNPLTILYVIAFPAVYLLVLAHRTKSAGIESDK